MSVSGNNREKISHSLQVTIFKAFCFCCDSFYIRLPGGYCHLTFQYEWMTLPEYLYMVR